MRVERISFQSLLIHLWKLIFLVYNLCFSISILQEVSFPNCFVFSFLFRIVDYSTFIPLEFNLVFTKTSYLKTNVCYEDLFYPTFSYSPELIDLLLTALENPVKYVEENMEQKVSVPVSL